VLEIHAYPVFDDGESLTNIVSCVVGATSRQKLQRMLRESDRRYCGIFEGLPIGVCWLSEDGAVLEANRTMRQFTGYSEAELSRMQLREFLHSAEDYERLWQRVGGQGVAHQVEGKLVRKDGTCLDARLSSSRLRVGGREVVLFSAIDITPRRKVEAQLQRVEQTLGQKEQALTQKSIALSEVVEQIEIEKKRLKEDIAVNIRELVYPVLEKLRLTEAPREYLDLLEHHLREIGGAFGIKIAKMAPSLSPREVEITGMIQGGLTSKQIACVLNICQETVEKHRRNIRKKVGISGKRINLVSFLQGGS
jgi:PAS domain S-box-containing protein